MSRTILVSGATGKQGKGVVDALLSSPAKQPSFKVFALTRNTESPAAKALADKYGSNLTLVGGDLDDCDAVFKAANTPIWGVFSVQVFSGGKASIESEGRQGKALADAAIKHGVKHFVYTSADRGGEERSEWDPTPIPHFASKHWIEKHLIEKAAAANGSMSWTILRPSAFMENLQPGMMTKGMITGLDVTRSADQPIWWIATKDIGLFAADAFRDPEQWKNKSISLAADSLNLKQMDELFQQKTGKKAPRTFGLLVSAMLWFTTDLRIMLHWLAENPYEVDIPRLRKMHPEMQTLSQWLDENWIGK
ncbi:MAG: hypothetical protein M4579_004106 [Chaenotheca gracillima]|nr:MAG: hypothetical protein M4579_004106 [Chaenotheca gracillima]